MGTLLRFSFIPPRNPFLRSSLVFLVVSCLYEIASNKIWKLLNFMKTTYDIEKDTDRLFLIRFAVMSFDLFSLKINRHNGNETNKREKDDL
jgi:hypothetical protein